MGNIDNKYMEIAMNMAKEAARNGDVPVGCVIVKDDVVVATGYNSREKNKNATEHAEIVAINEACRKLGGWRLLGCDMYVTLEPCPMCAGAILNARLARVIIAAKDANAGALGSVLNFNSYPLGNKVDLIYGINEEESRELLQSYFKEKRNSKTSGK